MSSGRKRSVPLPAASLDMSVILSYHNSDIQTEEAFMARTPRDVTERELAVLQVLWDAGPTTIRRLTDALYPGGGATHYATVQKLLDRLEAKGCVRRDRAGAATKFNDVSGIVELIGRRLRT